MVGSKAGECGSKISALQDRESSRAKPPEKGRFVPAGERAQIKISAFGHSQCRPEPHLSFKSGYFYSAWFSRSKRFSPKIGLFRQIFPASGGTRLSKKGEEVHKTLWDQENFFSLGPV